MKRVAVIDYGMGNLHSVAKAVEHAGREAGITVDVSITADAAAIAAADRLVFPGVGAIRDCMAEIGRLGIGDMVATAIESRPVLAICVGMQALMEHSEENGGVACLGLVPGEVRHFGDDLRDAAGARLKVPHMGWNQVRQTRAHPLWEGIPDGSRFYFVHGYYVQTAATGMIAGVSGYGIELVSALADTNVFATQFHPEKSQAPGLRLLGNFLRWNGEA